jgi:hypothetical protein
LAPGEIATVQPADCLLSFSLISHFDETEATAPTRITIDGDFRRNDFAVSSEEFGQIRVRSVERQISDE